MKTPTLLRTGECEVLKAGVHAVLMGTVTLCAAYNFAAWLVRHQRHSAINAGIYTGFVVWECVHVKHHVDCRNRTARPPQDENIAA